MSEYKKRDYTIGPVYRGSRDESFKCFIKGLLNKGKLKEHYINILLTDESLKMYSRAFTSESAEPQNNYEYLEFLGDATLKKIIPYHLNYRFPGFSTSKHGVYLATRLKIYIEQKEFFAELAEELGFWKYITATESEREDKKKSLLEDAFEAFFGTTEILIDKNIRLGVGYHICYNIMSNILNDIQLPLNYSDLVDSKTRLKETFDYFKDRLTGLEYKQIRDESKGLTTVEVVGIVDGKKLLLGKGTQAIAKTAGFPAAEQAVEILRKRGFIRPIDEEYKRVLDEIKESERN